MDELIACLIQRECSGLSLLRLVYYENEVVGTSVYIRTSVIRPPHCKPMIVPNLFQQGRGHCDHTKLYEGSRVNGNSGSRIAFEFGAFKECINRTHTIEIPFPTAGGLRLPCVRALSRFLCFAAVGLRPGCRVMIRPPYRQQTCCSSVSGFLCRDRVCSVLKHSSVTSFSVFVILR